MGGSKATAIAVVFILIAALCVMFPGMAAFGGAGDSLANGEGQAAVAITPAEGSPGAARESGALSANGEADPSVVRFVDEAGIVSSRDASRIESLLDEASARQEFDFVITVMQGLSGLSARSAAAGLFEEGGYGVGADRSGIMLLLAMEGRDYGYAALGFGNEAFTAVAMDYLDGMFLDSMRENEYYEAFAAFVEGAEDCVEAARDGRPFGRGNVPVSDAVRAQRRTTAVAVSIGIALLASLGVTMYWKMQLKSVRRKDLANAYVVGGVDLRARRDMFMYRNVTRTPKPKQGSGGGGGGFTSPGGRAATGRSGKF